MIADRRTFETSRRCSVGVALLLFASCSYDIGGHPQACETDFDCSADRRCFDDFCVVRSNAIDPTAGTGASTGGSPPLGGGSGGSSGAGGDAGSGGRAGQGGIEPMDSGTGGVGGGAPNDADVPDGDAGADSGTPPMVAPYAACASVDDCNAGDTCRMISGRGMCSPPCATETDCPMPDGTYEAKRKCDADGHCRLDCAPPLPTPFQVTCPPDMTCVVEATALLTCYGN